MVRLTAPMIRPAPSRAEMDRLPQRTALWLVLGVSAIAWACIGWLLATAL